MSRVFGKDAARDLGNKFCDEILINKKFMNKNVIKIDIKKKAKSNKKTLSLFLIISCI